MTKTHRQKFKAPWPFGAMVMERELMSVAKDGACAHSMTIAAQGLRQKFLAPYSVMKNNGHSHFDQQRDSCQESRSGLFDGPKAYSGHWVAGILCITTSLLGRIPPPRMRRGDAAKRADYLWRLVVLSWLIAIITIVIRWIPLQAMPQELSSAGAPRASRGPSVGPRNQDKIAEYMTRFNVPKQHVDLVWLKTGGTTIRRGDKTYHYTARKGNVGVYVGYSAMHDSSTQRYCERPAAKIDTQRTVGSSFMAAGACPNWGKVIAFTRGTGDNVDITQWKNEIHDNVMPHSTTGCQLHASRGSSEIPKEKEGLAMYAGYMTSCPFNEAVYQKDMIPDQEYDPAICTFVTLSNKLWFLDTKTPSPGKPFTPYAFHGNGGYLGYDYEGNTKHTGCPPYSPPKITSPMKDASWLTDPFSCVNLSRCTSHCWPFADGQPCFRSLPAMYDITTRECRLLGYHTQFFQQSICAKSPTKETNKFYCIKPVKNAGTSSLVYLTSHTRPDYDTQCPPREPLLNVQWGMISQSAYCEPLPEVKSLRDTTAEKCGQAVFENSSSDDPTMKLEGLHWGTFTGKDCPDMSQECGTTAKGHCALYNKVPQCFLRKTGAVSFTSLSAVNPSIAKAPEEVAVLPSDLCATVDCGTHGTCSDGKCVCEKGWTGERCDTPLPPPPPTPSPCENVICQNQGYCDEKTQKCVCTKCFEGTSCEVKISNCCLTDKDCGSNESCNVSSNTCVCKPGFTGPDCRPEGNLCTDDTCNGAGHCNPDTGKCTCYPCYYGEFCQNYIPDCCQTDMDCSPPRGKCNPETHLCFCKEGFGGPECQQVEDPLCQSWCVPPTNLKEDIMDCPTIDCYYYCCISIIECSSHADESDCYLDQMGKVGAACCLGEPETDNTVAYATAGGIAALVLLVAVGAGVVYTRKSRRMSNAEPSVEFERGMNHRDDEPPNEEAIDVTFDDFQVHPEDRSGVTKGIISTTWES